MASSSLSLGLILFGLWLWYLRSRRFECVHAEFTYFKCRENPNREKRELNYAREWEIDRMMCGKRKCIQHILCCGTPADGFDLCGKKNIKREREREERKREKSAKRNGAWFSMSTESAKENIEERALFMLNPLAVCGTHELLGCSETR